MINILTRTSNRPNYFATLADSIAAQTDKDFRWIVHSDNFEQDSEYLKEHFLIDRIVKGTRLLKQKSLYQNKQHAEGIQRCYHAPYNTYLNNLAEYVNEGWVMYLDDDDMFENEDAIKRLNLLATRHDENTLHIFNGIFNNEKKLPSDKGVQYVLRGVEPPYGHIGGRCFMFHSKWLTDDLWDEWSCSDARAIGRLLQKGLKPVYTPTTITKDQQGAHNGEQKDKEARQ